MLLGRVNLGDLDSAMAELRLESVFANTGVAIGV